MKLNIELTKDELMTLHIAIEHYNIFINENLKNSLKYSNTEETEEYTQYWRKRINDINSIKSKI